MTKSIAILWDNFGPLHIDRCNSVVRHFSNTVDVIGIEVFAQSALYDWQQPDAEEFRKVTLFQADGWSNISTIRIANAVVNAVRGNRCEAAFLCHYDQPAMLVAAAFLRLAGIPVFTMGCSKFDDAKRTAPREWVKRQFYRPYLGGIGSEYRSTSYMRQLGLPGNRVLGGYNTVDQTRIRSLAEAAPERAIRFEDRPFLVVARLIWEKNFPGLFAAFAAYCGSTSAPRKLQIAGSGPLEGELHELAVELRIDTQIEWLGFVQTENVAPLMRDALCLCLPSVSETFGNVVPEALAVELPVLISQQCGAADRLVEDGANGFTFDSHDVKRLAELMRNIGESEAEWQRLRVGAKRIAPLGDAARFAESIAALLG